MPSDHFDLRHTDIFCGRPVYTTDITFFDLVWVNDGDILETKPRNLFGYSRARATYTNNSDLQVVNYLLTLLPKRSDLTIKDLIARSWRWLLFRGKNLGSDTHNSDFI